MAALTTALGSLSVANSTCSCVMGSGSSQWTDFFSGFVSIQELGVNILLFRSYLIRNNAVVFVPLGVGGKYYAAVSTDFLSPPPGVTPFVGWFVIAFAQAPTINDASLLTKHFAARTLKSRIAELKNNTPFPFFDSLNALPLRPYFVSGDQQHQLVPAELSTTLHRPKDAATAEESFANFLRFSFVISGPSGTGKTVAACQLAGKLGDRCIFGVFYMISKPELLNSGPLTADEADRFPQRHLDSQIVDIANAVRQSFVDYARKCRITSPPRGHSLTGVHLHLVLDEIGFHPALVTRIAGQFEDFKKSLHKALEENNDATPSAVAFADVQEMTITVALVGTGVDCAGVVGGSIGFPFWRVYIHTSH